MLHRLATPAHGHRIAVEPLLNRFDNVLVLPSRNAPLVARPAFALVGVAAARVGPVAARRLTLLDVAVAIRQLLASGTAISVLGVEIEKVLLAKPAFRFGARRHRFGERHRDAGQFAFEDLGAVVVAPVDGANRIVVAYLIVEALPQ